MLVVQNKGNGGNVGVSQINHAGIELYFYTEVLFVSVNQYVKTLLRPKEGHMTEANTRSV